MPLHEAPIQKCGAGHWLTDPCPRDVCDLLVFERDIPVYRPVKNRIDLIREETIPPQVMEASVQHDPDQFGEIAKPRVEVAKAAIDEGVKKEALSAAEKQRRYRERQKAKRQS